jgi:hypothetical protein
VFLLPKPCGANSGIAWQQRCADGAQHVPTEGPGSELATRAPVEIVRFSEFMRRQLRLPMPNQDEMGVRG